RIKNKLIGMNLGICLMSFIIAIGCTHFLTSKFEKQTLDSEIAQCLKLVHTLAGRAALVSKDQHRLRIALNAISTMPIVKSAAIYSKQGNLLEHGVLRPDLPQVVDAEQETTTPTGMRGISRRIVMDGETLGWLFIELDSGPMGKLRTTEISVLIIFLALSALASALITSKITRLVASPIQQLVLAMGSVSEQQDFSIRLNKTSNDEVGALADGFNAMLGEIEQRDSYLKAVNEELDKRVKIRTTELELQVSERSKAEELLAEANDGLETALTRARRMADAAEAANRAKSEFLANISHEVRTPLNGVLGMADLLLDSGLDHEQRDFAVTIKKSSQSLLDIINDLLDYSKAEAGKMSIEHIEFSLSDVIDDVGDLYAQSTRDKDLSFYTFCDPNIPSIIGDPTRIKQVLSNLVTNAIKFTERGEVSVRAELSGVFDNTASLRLTVTDSGIGIPADRQAAIFESFTQADGSTTRRYGGTGLGLTISKQLAALMGGTLTVCSEVGQGSTFTLLMELPLGEGRLRHPMELIGKQVLIVDTDTRMLNDLRHSLETWGCRVAAVSGTQEAFRTLREWPTDVPIDILVTRDSFDDLPMSQLAWRFRGEDRWQGLPILALSQTISQASDPQTKFFVVARPVRRTILQRTMLHAWGFEYQEGTDSTATRSDVKRGKILLVEDNAINRKVANHILQRIGCTVDSAENGQVALELLAASWYDAVLMDIQMPVLDGFETTQRIRAREHQTGRHIPIIAMTANASENDRSRCLRGGMDDYLPKPISADDLASTLDRWLGGEPVAEAPIARSAAGMGSFDMNGLLDRCGGDESFMYEVVGEFERSLSIQLSRIESALQTKDITGASYHAHALKGASRSIGAEPIARICEQIEDSKSDSTLDPNQLLKRLIFEIDAFRGVLIRVFPKAA
ncbi:MAG: response regulator, partial [Fimbriimonadaceae bacterium]